ncbi:MAG: hypothetical protein JXA96_14365 [Sedimentisphaerales bacterium]|nr:hypothetical protein [Sedimentisphaerales bacterium]
MEREVEDFIQNLSDIDLIEYAHTKLHLPEAVHFAKVELARRKLPPEKMKELNDQWHARIKAQEEEIRKVASEPLPGKLKILVFLCGLYLALPLLIFIPAWCKFQNEGSEQKCKDMYIFAGAGFILQIVMILLKIPPWSWLLKIF